MLKLEEQQRSGNKPRALSLPERYPEGSFTPEHDCMQAVFRCGCVGCWALLCQAVQPGRGMGVSCSETAIHVPPLPPVRKLSLLSALHALPPLPRSRFPGSGISYRPAAASETDHEVAKRACLLVSESPTERVVLLTADVTDLMMAVGPCGERIVICTYPDE